jgi:ADP-ribose pyrophosphatase
MKAIVPADAILVPANAKRVFKGEIFEVYQWPQALYDGTTATFEMLKRPDTVETACVVDGKLLIVNDEQPNRGPKLTFPGGRVDAGEVPDDAAKREVLEETGYEFKNWKLVRVWQREAKIEWFLYLYVAWDGTKTREPKPDAGDKITSTLLPFAEAKRLILSDAGYLKDYASVFENLQSPEDLVQLPTYVGRTIER